MMSKICNCVRRAGLFLPPWCETITIGQGRHHQCVHRPASAWIATGKRRAVLHGDNLRRGLAAWSVCLLLASSAGAQELRTDQRQRFVYCIIGNLIEGNESFGKRGSLANRCLVEFPHNLSNAEVKEALDYAVKLVEDYGDELYNLGEDAGREFDIYGR